VILRFLREFLVVFMVFLLQSPICLCCNRGVGGKVEKVKVFGGVVDVRWMDCAVGRLSRGVLRASPFIAVFGCLCCGVEE
jgi:hypothetical protein